MEFIIENWPIIVAALAAAAVLTAAVVTFAGLPTEAQLAKVKEWLLWAVTEAEKDLGGGTGKLKLRQVYDLTRYLRVKAGVLRAVQRHGGRGSGADAGDAGHQRGRQGVCGGGVSHGKARAEYALLQPRDRR